MATASAHRLEIALLQASHVIDGVDGGDPARNAWLQRRAMASQASDDARVYVAADPKGQVAGFHAITTASILRGMLPGAPRRNAPDPIRCVLLAQRAVEKSFQGQGLSIQLVPHAMTQACKIADIAGCRLLILHPATAALSAYDAKFGLVELDTAPIAIMATRLRRVGNLLAG